MTQQQTLDLEQLNDDYEVIGELSARDDARTLIARRKDSGADVLITVVETPSGDEGNALSHLAADTKRLTELRHRNVLPILDGRWVGADAFATVTERVRFPTLAEVLVRRDEGFACPRVALVLQEINAALEWARTEKIVHRALTPDTIYLEPGSDRVLLTFAVQPLPLAEMPGPERDARTIATLARAMLTRSVADPERDRLPLGEVRPGLPDRLIEQTEQLMQLDRNSAVPDMSEYIAIVAMSDNLKRSEMECAETTRKLLDEERQAREKLEAERTAAERAAAEQARLFQEEREAFAREREKMLRAIEKERETVARERTLLEKERADHAQDRTLLLKEREEHKRWADEVERAFKAQKDAFAAEQAALQQEASRNADTDKLETPVAEKTAIAIPPRPAQPRYKPEWQRTAARLWSRRPRVHWNKRWNVPAAAAAVVLLVALAAIAIAGRDEPRRTAAATPAAPARVVDSVAGGVATPVPASATPSPAPEVAGIPADFVNSVAGPRRPVASGVPQDFVAGVMARRAASATSEPPPYAASSVQAGSRPQPSRPVQRTIVAPRSAPLQPDTMLVPVAPTLPGAVAPRPDTTRPDTTNRVRPDTIRPDTIPARR